MFYIYEHLRLDNKVPFYIGKGCNDRAYWKKRNNKGWNNIVNKVGFEPKILKYFDDENDALDYEHMLIKKYREEGIELVNQTKYSSGGKKWAYTDEVKARQSLGQMGTKRPKSKEWREKLSKVHKGREILWADKISEAHKGKPKNYPNGKKKKVYQHLLSGGLINEFSSATEAGKHLKKSGHSIADCASGRQKTAYGFKWKYEEN